MRQIKFRVWVEEPDGENALHYPKLISFGSGEVSWLTLQDDSVIKDNGWYTRREVMQYTGLKDKNGVEIYEGDIVRYGKDEPYEIIFTKGMFTLGERSAFSLETYNKESKVIGNIYQNPELLKGA